MIFEGQYRMTSQVGRDQESQAYYAAADTILTSVR
jgi:hypothetical protein